MLSEIRIPQTVSSLFLSLLITISACAEPKPPPKPTIDKSPEMQQQRLKLIKELISHGVFSKVEDISSNSSRPMPNVWVGSIFYNLDFEQKEKLLGVVYAYYFDGSDRSLIYLMDRRTGKKVGIFIPGSLDME